MSQSASRKVYVTGSRSDIRVPMREIALSGGNPPLRLYDTSGPYTDPNEHLDLKRGLTPLRLGWIIDRGDVEELAGPSSAYRRSRDENPALGGVRFASVRSISQRSSFGSPMPMIPPEQTVMPAFRTASRVRRRSSKVRVVMIER